MANNSDGEADRPAPATGTYSVPDLAALLKSSEKHIRRMAEAGELPGVIRFRRLVRWSKRPGNEGLATGGVTLG